MSRRAQDLRSIFASFFPLVSEQFGWARCVYCVLYSVGAGAQTNADTDTQYFRINIKLKSPRMQTELQQCARAHTASLLRLAMKRRLTPNTHTPFCRVY